MKPMAEEYRRDLLGEKTFELTTNDIKMEVVFGTLHMEEMLRVSE